MKERIVNFLVYYSVPLILVSVFLIQLYHRHNGLNAWKGGGFGMYTDFDPDTYMLTIEPLDEQSSMLGFLTLLTKGKLDSLETEVKCYPSLDKIAILGMVLKNEYSISKFKITVWKPFLIPENGYFGFRRFNSMEFQ